jgi:hypothetical protein
MRVCIVVGGRRLLQDPLLEAVLAVRAAGGQVTTITWFPVGPAIVAATAAQVELRTVDARRRSTPVRTRAARITGIDRLAQTRVARITGVDRLAQTRVAHVARGANRRVTRAAHVAHVDLLLHRVNVRAEHLQAGLQRRWEKLRRKAKLDGQAALVHRLVSRDPLCRTLVAEADIVVAGDPTSIRAVWFVVRRRPEIKALYGLVALRTYLSGRAS